MANNKWRELESKDVELTQNLTSLIFFIVSEIGGRHPKLCGWKEKVVIRVHGTIRDAKVARGRRNRSGNVFRSQGC